MFDRNAYQRELMRKRRAAEKAARPQLVQQHAAHVCAWMAALPAIKRLEHRSFVRRCLLEKQREERAKRNA